MIIVSDAYIFVEGTITITGLEDAFKKPYWDYLVDPSF